MIRRIMNERNYINFAAYWILVAKAEKEYEMDGKTAEYYRKIKKARKLAEDKDNAMGVVVGWMMGHKILDFKATE